MIVKLLTERHLEFLSITGGCRGPSESTLVKMSNCWKSRALAHMISSHLIPMKCKHVANFNYLIIFTKSYIKYITSSELQIFCCSFA